MARAKAKPMSQRARRESEIRRLVVLDALRGMAAPAIAMAGILVLWVLFNAELMNVGPALTATALLVLFMMVHFGLRDFLSERTPKTIAIGVGLFAIVWMIGFGWPLHGTISPPAPLYVGELHTGGAPVKVPLGGDAGQYRVVVTGHMPLKEDRASHGGGYHLRVSDDTGLDQTVEGTFSEAWKRQRLGRRGGVPVRVIHSVAQHPISSSAGHDLNLALIDLNGDIGNSVGVEVFKQAISSTLFSAIGLVLTVGALAIDAWRPDVAHDGLMTIETLAAIFGVGAFRWFGNAHPGFGDLFVNGMLGGVFGAGAGALLWRALRTQVRKLLPVNS